LKVEKLSVGMIVKNYKELCALLEVDILEGNSRKAQLKDFERYFSYHKQGHKFILDEIYKVPLSPNNNITQYIPIIEKLILHHIVNEGYLKERLYIPKSKLLKLLKMINKQYSEFKYKQMRLSHNTGIPKETILDFYRTSDDLLERNTEKALNSLVSQSLIQWQHVFTVVEVDKIENEDILLQHETVIDEYGDMEENSIYKSHYLMRKHREATEEETKAILRIQHELLNKYNLNTLQEVMKIGIAEKFYNEVREQLQKEYNLITYYKSYEMIFNSDHIEAKYNSSVDQFILESKEEISLFLELNEQISNTISKNSKDRHDKARNGIGSSKMIGVRKDESYITDTNKLIRRLIKIAEKDKK